MEMQINDLVSAIKKDGVDAAQKEADAIIAEAKKKADAIILEANEKANTIRKKTESEIDVLKKSTITAAEHAKRDAMLAFKAAVQDEFDKLLDRDISKAVNEEVLAKLIIAAVNGHDASNLLAEVTEVTEGLKGELAKAIKDGLEIKANKKLGVGFRLTFKDGTGYFDCSDKELSQMLLQFFPELSI